MLGNEEKIETNANSIIFIGANGAGKSRLGAWIELQNPDKVHRIGAQRSLNFSDNIPLKSVERRILSGTGDTTFEDAAA